MTTTFDLQALAGRVGIRVADRPQALPEALQLDPEPTPTRTHRPGSVVEMIGQEEIRVQLAMRLRAAKVRGEQPGHRRLFAPPGRGKTTLAEIVAAETG